MVFDDLRHDFHDRGDPDDDVVHAFQFAAEGERIAVPGNDHAAALQRPGQFYAALHHAWGLFELFPIPDYLAPKHSRRDSVVHVARIRALGQSRGDSDRAAFRAALPAAVAAQCEAAGGATGPGGGDDAGLEHGRRVLAGGPGVRAEHDPMDAVAARPGFSGGDWGDLGFILFLASKEDAAAAAA